MSEFISTRWSDEFSDQELTDLELYQRKIDESREHLSEHLREIQEHISQLEALTKFNDDRALEIVKEFEIDQSVLLVSRKQVSWSFSEEDGYKGEGDPVKLEHVVDLENARELKVGRPYKVDVAAPGIGYRLYRITKIDEKGVWGYLTLDCVREMTPEEAR